MSRLGSMTLSLQQTRESDGSDGNFHGKSCNSSSKYD